MIPTLEHSASHSAMLWVVSSTDWPALTTPLITDHRNWRELGSTPEVGSSWRRQDGTKEVVRRQHLQLALGSVVVSSHALTRSSRRGVPRRAMAAESFLRLPPEYWLAGLSACSVRSSLCRAHSTTCRTCSPTRASQAKQ